jgi:uncharacterized protein (TIGR02147 family)
VTDIFDYLEYRKFLIHRLSDRKKEKSGFSKRFVARELGCDSAFLIRVLQGKKELTEKYLGKMAALFKLKEHEAEYFRLLVLLSKTKAHASKREVLEKITRLRKSKAQKLESSQYEFYEKWYYTAIRELLDFYPFRDDYKALARNLDPTILPHEAKKGIKVLEDLGLIKLDPAGHYVKSDPVITSGEGWKSVAIANYQLGNLDLAKRAFEKYGEGHRDFSTLTLSISKDTADSIMLNLKQFRAECLELARGDQSADRVYQMNFQVFPISKIGKEGGGNAG